MAVAEKLTERVPAVAVSVLTPGAGLRVQLPTEARPCASVTTSAPVTEPEFVPGANVTRTPFIGPLVFVTLTVGAAVTALPYFAS